MVLLAVVSAGSGTRPASEVAQAAAEHGHGACLQVSVPGTGAEALPDEGRVDTLLASVRLEPGEVGLFLDAGPVTGPSRKALTPRVLEALTSPPGRPWRSVCLASGAFPLNLAGFPRSRATPVARGDARLWRDIAERWRYATGPRRPRSDPPQGAAQKPRET